MKQLYSFLSFLLLVQTGNAQIDLQCSGRDQHSLYLLETGVTNAFYRIDSVDTHPTAPIFLETNDGLNAIGISVNKNLNGLADTSMYIIDNYGEYQYFDGSNWVHTGHYNIGSGSDAVNIGGTDAYIFNYAVLPGIIYRYDGTANDTPLVTGLPPTPHIADVATDRDGNFYLFSTLAHKVFMYNANGIPVDSLTTTGNTEGGGGGFVILGHKIYFTTAPSPGEPNGILFEGTIIGSNIDFTPIDTFSTGLIYRDVGACPNAAEPLAVFEVPEAPHFIIYPNPAAGNATIKLDNATSLEVHDDLGRLMFSAGTAGRTQYALQLDGFPSGMYVVTARSPNGLTAHRSLLVQ